MTLEFVCYVDEAGDEGFGKLRSPQKSGQSKWLVLGAAIVSRDNDAQLPGWRDEIMSLFPAKRRTDLHFRDLNHGQRVAACRELAKRPIGFAAVASNNLTIIGSGREHVFKRKGYLYNYLVRYLLERVTATLRERGVRDGSTASVKVIFSRRGGTDYQSMRDYLILMRDGREVVRPVRSIDWSVLDPNAILVENHSKRAGLQIADVLTSATAAALEPNIFDDIEPRYALTICRRFLRTGGCIANRGLTLIPPPDRSPLSPAQRTFLEELEEKARAPGP